MKEKITGGTTWLKCPGHVFGLDVPEVEYLFGQYARKRHVPEFKGYDVRIYSVPYKGIKIPHRYPFEPLFVAIRVPENILGSPPGFSKVVWHRQIKGGVFFIEKF
jgi:hypothetical protein